MMVMLLFVAGVVGPLGIETQSAQAAPDTHYGYVNLSNWQLTYTANTCDIVTYGATMFGVYITDGPGSVADCLRRYPSIVGVVIKTYGTVTLSSIESSFLKTWTGHNPTSWSRMPATFPNVTFVMQIGNEPSIDANVTGRDPWQAGWAQKNTIQTMINKYRSGRPNLVYAAALGTASPTACGYDQAFNPPKEVCGLDYVKILVEGQRVCQVDWGCTIHSYWDNLSGGYSSGPSHWRDLVNYVQGSPYVPRVAVTEQGINQNSGGNTYVAAEDCKLRQYTNQYPSKVRIALTYIVAYYNPDDPDGGNRQKPDGWDTYGIDSRSDISICVS